MVDTVVEGPFAAPLDLDEEPIDRLPVMLFGKTYWMQARLDMSMAAQEEFRLIYVQIANVRQSPEGDDGFLSSGQQELLEAMEIRLCGIALPELTPDDLHKLRGEANARRRNRLLEAFLEQPGMPGRRAAPPAMPMRAPAVDTTPPPTKLAPLQQPSGSTPKSRRGSSTPTEVG